MCKWLIVAVLSLLAALLCPAAARACQCKVNTTSGACELKGDDCSDGFSCEEYQIPNDTTGPIITCSTKDPSGNVVGEDINTVNAGVQYDNAGFCSIPEPGEKTVEYLCEFKRICWYCDAFDEVFKMMDIVSRNVFNTLKMPLIALMAALFALWLAWHVFLFLTKNVAGGGPQGTETYQTLIGGVFRLMLAVTLLMAGREAIMELTLNPVIGVGLYVSNAIVNPPPAEGEGVALIIDESGAVTTLGSQSSLGALSCPSEEETEWETSETSKKSKKLKEAETGFEFIRANFKKILKSFNDQFMVVVGRGVLLVKYAFASATGLTKCLIPALDSFMAGMVLILFSLAVLIRVPLRLVDAVFHLVVLCVMLPIFIVCWVFPYSRAYAKKGFEMLIGVLGMFITMSVMIAIITGAMGMLAENVKDVNDVAEFAQSFSWARGREIFYWLGVLVFCYCGFGSVNDFAKTLFGAPAPNIAKDAIKGADSIAQNVVTAKPLRSAAKGAGNLAAWGVKKWAGQRQSPPAPVAPRNYSNAADQDTQNTFGQNDADGVVRDNDDSTLIRNTAKYQPGKYNPPEKGEAAESGYEDYLKE